MTQGRGVLQVLQTLLHLCPGFGFVFNISHFCKLTEAHIQYMSQTGGRL